MLKEKIKWGPDRHAAYKTDLNEHIGRSIERYLMRKDDGKADTDTRGVKVAKSTRRLVDTNTHARYAKDRLADALAALATIGHTPL